MTLKKILLIPLIFLIENTTLANRANSSSFEEKTTNFIITPSVSYRYDVFKWAIPDVHHPLKKCSELTWKNYIIQPGVKLETEPKANEFTFLGQAKYGYILKNSSKSWDKDWWVHKQKSGKVISTHSSNALSVVKGNVLDLSGAMGYSFNLPKSSLLTFYIGYDYTDYRNNQYGGRQLVDNQNKLVISFDKLITKYNFKTKSPWVGLSINTPFNDKFSIIPTIKYYSFKYIGKGYWLLIEEFKQNPSFKQTAKGQGLGFDVDFLYKYTDNLDFKINLETKRFKIKKGQFQTFYIDENEFNKIARQKRNLYHLSLISSSISCGVRYKL